MRIPSKNDFWFLPLGGSNEIGMNLNLFGHDGKWLMVDCGISFFDRIGIEVITPDPAFIAKQKDRLVGLVLTHAHEDHVGAVPYLWPYLRCPVYATPFTANILRDKLADRHWKKEVKIIEVPLSGKVSIENFDVEFITLTHSIPEPNALAITTKLGTVIHTGDWKIDPEPLIGETTDKKRLEQMGEKGVLAMICDSTNVFTEGTSGSEGDVRLELMRLVKEHPKKRIIVACFASNVARLETAAKAAQEIGRGVVLVGRSLLRMVRAAKDSGYLKDLFDFIDPMTAKKMKDSDVLFICTGSQGEPRSALTRMANHQHPDFKLGSNDIVFFSSRIIPGNEKSISAVQNMLVEKGAQVITAHEENIHVSGHPARDELRQMYQWVKPKIVIPVHGEQRHLHEQAALAKNEGIAETIIPSNGTIIQIREGGSSIIDRVEAGRLALDGHRMIPFDHALIKDRFKISNEGVVFATLIVNEYGELLKPPTLSMIGICLNNEEIETVQKDAYKQLRAALTRDFKSEIDCSEAMKKIMRAMIKHQFGKKPIVEIHFVMQR